MRPLAVYIRRTITRRSTFHGKMKTLRFASVSYALLLLLMGKFYNITVAKTLSLVYDSLHRLSCAAN